MVVACVRLEIRLRINHVFGGVKAPVGVQGHIDSQSLRFLLQKQRAQATSVLCTSRFCRCLHGRKKGCWLGQNATFVHAENVVRCPVPVHASGTGESEWVFDIIVRSWVHFSVAVGRHVESNANAVNFPVGRSHDVQHSHGSFLSKMWKHRINMDV